ncbi:alpha/beta hydrolase family protein [Aestuariimicrobium kwangyangense]|uniref:alpha/beta hydrolase family protein n=1 Tax=Aestuariimicrobium kwangyangense TaxID=396389 RepID=UPI0003B79CDF|nr:prolyl oligopeptidase family serine peptidase [Aestuariimicrobium kwangyangense]
MTQHPLHESTTSAASTRPRLVTVDEALAGAPSWSELRADRDRLLWLESRPTENRRTTIVDGDGVELTPAPFCVRSRVMEYGGGAWDARDGVVVAVDDVRNQVIEVATDRAVTPASSQVRYGGLQVHPNLDLLLAVREDHRGPGEAVTTVVALRLSGANDDFGQVLVSGPDFVAGPRLSPDGRLAWFEWNHPDMPWDRSTVRTAPLAFDEEGGSGWQLGEVTTVMDEPEVSAQHPQWDVDPSGTTTLWFMADESGYWNLHSWTPEQGSSLVWPVDADCDHPVWTLTGPSWTVSGGRLLVHQMVQGWPRLAVIDLVAGVVRHPECDGLAEVRSCVVAGNEAHALVGLVCAGDALVRVRLDEDHPRVAQRAGGRRPDWQPTVPTSITVSGSNGDVQAWLYLPAPAEHAPALIVKSHGGPTSSASIAHSPLNDFWTSRGYAVVDVNYSGSTGFGRDYRNRLRGQWGLLDVADCVAVVDHLVDAGAVDPRKVSITGGSAGGYTTLQSLVSTDRYTAGVSRYGIGDLVMLATDTHKFESRYLDSLVGPWPADEATYLARSPIHHVDRLSTPMLILQGSDDRVVPPNQAETMAEAVRSKGLPVELKLYPGEGHGFRGGEARRDALERELTFYERLFG